MKSTNGCTTARPKASKISKASEFVVVTVIVPVIGCCTMDNRCNMVQPEQRRPYLVPGLVAVGLAHLTAVAVTSLELKTATQENVKHG